MEGHASQAVNGSRSTTVILLAGLPASGKSTLARRLKEEYCRRGEETGRRAIHLEYDELEDSIVSQKTEEARREAWNQARQVAVHQLEERLREQFAAVTSNDHSHPPLLVLLDDNFHLRGMRKQIHRLLLNYKPISFGIIWVQAPLEKCMERNRDRQRQVPDSVLEKINETMELPRAAWESNWISVVDETPLQDILAFVESCPEILDLPEKADEEQQEADRQLTMQNQSHNWDNILRTWVGKVAKYDKTLAKGANEARKSVMKLAKDNDGNLTQDDFISAFVELVVADDKSKSQDELVALLKNHN